VGVAYIAQIGLAVKKVAEGTGARVGRRELPRSGFGLLAMFLVLRCGFDMVRERGESVARSSALNTRERAARAT
jgi:hypothetical protein